MSVASVTYYDWRRAKRIAARCSLPDLLIGETVGVKLSVKDGYRFNLVLPEEIKIEKESVVEDERQYLLRNTRPGFSSFYAIFSVMQTPVDAQEQATLICPSRLSTIELIKKEPSLIPDSALLGLLFAGLIVAALIFHKKETSALSFLEVVVARHAFSVSVVSGFYLAYRKAFLLAQFMEPSVNSCCGEEPLNIHLRQSLQALVRWLYFRGPDYEPFFTWAADLLYLYILLGNGFVLYFLIKPTAASDKYWHLMRSFYSLPGLRHILGLKAEKKFYWQVPCRFAALSLLIKAFYIPLMCSWAIQKAAYIYHSAGSGDWSFMQINSLILAALIFIDVSIFALGYLSELPQLGNVIGSVESTVLGWAVCLICYPPFNYLLLGILDRPLNEQWRPQDWTGPMLHQGVLICVTLLWAIYVWATIALGFKASNLTNRGVVSQGPYRYVRHPAYVSKVSLWVLSAFFIGEMNFYLVVSFVIIYALRAWTEERHLSRDPEYRAYQKRVPYLMVPGVI